MNAGQIIVIALIVGGIIFFIRMSREYKRDEVERRAREEENKRRKREENERWRIDYNERMKKYREEYYEYIKGKENKVYPGNIRPFTFEEWREFHKKY